MKRVVYLVAFAVVAVFTILGAASALLSYAQVQIPFVSLLVLSDLFGRPVPTMLRPLVPTLLNILLFWVFVGLVLRRVAFLATKRGPSVPTSFTRIPFALTSIALVSLALSMLGFALSMALRAGSGVPAGMLAIPAALLLAPVFAWVEARSVFGPSEVARES